MVDRLATEIVLPMTFAAVLAVIFKRWSGPSATTDRAEPTLQRMRE